MIGDIQSEDVPRPVIVHIGNGLLKEYTKVVFSLFESNFHSFKVEERGWFESGRGGCTCISILVSP